ncbi:MAG TPA: hypothetical protein VGJ20_11650 [Xanthobacteraceae bacterium]|jgi:hypothetical protein
MNLSLADWSDEEIDNPLLADVPANVAVGEPKNAPTICSQLKEVGRWPQTTRMSKAAGRIISLKIAAGGIIC